MPHFQRQGRAGHYKAGLISPFLLSLFFLSAVCVPYFRAMGDNLNDDDYLLDFDHRLGDEPGLGLAEKVKSKKRKNHEDENIDIEFPKKAKAAAPAVDENRTTKKQKGPPPTKKSKSSTYGQVLDWTDPTVQHESLRCSCQNA
jgi:hypothetical protein